MIKSVQVKFPQIAHRYSSRVDVLGYIPSLHTHITNITKINT